MMSEMRIDVLVVLPDGRTERATVSSLLHELRVPVVEPGRTGFGQLVTTWNGRFASVPDEAGTIRELPIFTVGGTPTNQ